MNKSNILHLASQSRSRQQLLTETEIPFKLISHNSSEVIADPTQPLDQIVAQLAVEKMEHVDLPDAHEQSRMFVLTADTLTQDASGKIYGKPATIEQAISYIKTLSPDAYISTGFCLDYKEYRAGQWQVTKRIVRSVSATCQMDIDDAWLATYVKKIPVLSIAGAMQIEGFAAQFVRSINGSYTAILGLPMCELRHALSEMGFFG